MRIVAKTVSVAGVNQERVLNIRKHLVYNVRKFVFPQSEIWP